MSQRFTEIKLYKITIIVEGFLLILSLVWAQLRSLKLPIIPDIKGLLIACICAAGLFAVSMGLRWLSSHFKSFKTFASFENEILKPLCSHVTRIEALVIALCSGVAEELFFRGILDAELIELLGQFWGITLSASVFAFLHFGPAAATYAPVLLVYFLFALCLSALYLLYNNLFPCIVFHIVYNFLALNFYASLAQQTPSDPAPRNSR